MNDLSLYSIFVVWSYSPFILLQLREKDENSYWMMQLLTRNMVWLTQYPDEDCIELHKNKLSQVIHEYPFHTAYRREKAIDTEGVEILFRILGSGLRQGFWWWQYLYSLSASPCWHVPLQGAWFYISSWIYVLSIATKSSSFSCCEMHIAWMWCRNPRCNSDRFICGLCQLLWKFCVTWSSASVKGLRSHLVLKILSTVGCREMPTPGNIQQLILQVAWYELVSKPLGALLSLYRGVFTEYHPLVAFQLVTYMICTGLLMPPQDQLWA